MASVRLPEFSVFLRILMLTRTVFIGMGMMPMGGRGGFGGVQGHFNPAFMQGGGGGAPLGPDGPRKRFKMDDSG